MFELLTPTKAKLLDVVVLSQKNRKPDEHPGAKLKIEMQLPNDALSFFDGSLKAFLFTKHGKASAQASLEGVNVVSDLPNLTRAGMAIGKLPWDHESTGYELELVLGIGSKRSNLTIGDCILSNWRFTPKEGGTVVARVFVESADVSSGAWPRLAELKSREIELMLRPPAEGQRSLEPPAAATGGNGVQLSTEAAWPFPKGQQPGNGAGPAEPPQDATVGPGVQVAAEERKAAKAKRGAKKPAKPRAAKGAAA